MSRSSLVTLIAITCITLIVVILLMAFGVINVPTKVVTDTSTTQSAMANFAQGFKAYHAAPAPVVAFPLAA